MKCPICGYAQAKSRCPQCNETLTAWIDYSAYARQAYGAGLAAVAGGATGQAAELLLRAVVLAPDVHEYLDAYGRVLGQLQRYQEAEEVLSRACGLKPDAGTRAALAKAKELARAPRVQPVLAPPPEPEPVATAEPVAEAPEAPAAQQEPVAETRGGVIGGNEAPVV